MVCRVLPWCHVAVVFYYNQDEKIPLAIENYNSKLERKGNNCKIADT